MRKKPVDIAAMICLLIAIVSGFMLHVGVHHHHIYNNRFLWGIHESAGILMFVAVIIHCLQHKYWFKNYRRIPVKKKRVTTILLAILVILFISGAILMGGSQSEEISIIHYAIGIASTILAIGHVIKRWKLFKIAK